MELIGNATSWSAMVPSALIKLALSELDCVSVPDLFHALRGLAQPIGSAIGRQVSQHGGWICWGFPSIPHREGNFCFLDALVNRYT